MLPGGGTVTGTVMVTWNGSVPFVQVYIPRSVLWTTRPATITWTSNLTPCSVSGGGLSLTGQSSNGSTTATQNSPADVTYTVSCGAGSTTASQTATASFVTPSVALEANDTDRILGTTRLAMEHCSRCLRWQRRCTQRRLGLDSLWTDRKHLLSARDDDRHLHVHADMHGRVAIAVSECHRGHREQRALRQSLTQSHDDHF
jgi:hypothetical protein